MSTTTKIIRRTIKVLLPNFVPITPPMEEKVPRNKIIKNIACRLAITK
jgi:hypothetical protein